MIARAAFCLLLSQVLLSSLSALAQEDLSVEAPTLESKPEAKPEAKAEEPTFDPDDRGVEDLYDKFDQDQAQKQKQQQEKEKAQADAQKAPVPDVKSISELSKLAPFEDIAVIQRRFLPRTGRFELSASGLTSINNPFFNNLGLSLRAAYFLSEKWGFEGHGILLSSARRDVTVNLEDKRRVKTSNLVTAKSYVGGAVKWTPIYGKITLLNQRILPFDLYFNGGLGLTQTQKQGEPTLHLGTGQSFAMGKSFAVRWDLTWHYYQAEVDRFNSTGAVVGTTTTGHSDLLLMIGASFFFPEATYR